MAERSPTIACEGVPLDEARRMSRGPRMDPQVYQQLRTRLQSLSDHAVRMTIPDGTSPTTMKHRSQRVAVELGIPFTIRRESAGPTGTACSPHLVPADGNLLKGSVTFS
jgi:hypothetical protein